MPDIEDVPALLAEVDRLTEANSRLAQKIMNGTRDINDALAPEIERQKAEAWDQGAESGETFGRDRWRWASGPLVRALYCLTEYPERPANPYREWGESDAD